MALIPSPTSKNGGHSTQWLLWLTKNIPTNKPNHWDLQDKCFSWDGLIKKHLWVPLSPRWEATDNHYYKHGWARSSSEGCSGCRVWKWRITGNSSVQHMGLSSEPTSKANASAPKLLGDFYKTWTWAPTPNLTRGSPVKASHWHFSAN